MDVYRNEIPASKNVSDYAFYMTFFPHLVAGPIVRAKDFLPQILDPQPINAALYKESLLRIMSGLLKTLHRRLHWQIRRHSPRTPPKLFWCRKPDGHVWL